MGPYRRITRLLSGCVVAAMLLCLIPIAAHAYEVSTTPTGLTIKMFTPGITYHVNATNAPSGAVTALQTAMGTWNDVGSSNFVYTYGGSTTNANWATSDGENIIMFGTDASLGTGTLACNGFWYRSTGELYESDIIFNTNYSWSTSGGASYYDVQNVATHELGHTLSLKDLYTATDTEKTMYGYSSPGETKQRSLDTDDIAGITYLYPATAPSSATLTPSTTSTTYGSSVTLTATASGGTGPYEYSFWLMGPGTGNVWVQKTAYSTTNTWTWTPWSVGVGTNYVCVWVRNVGSSASYETFANCAVTVTAATPPNAVTLTPSKTSTTYGIPVTFTASASGGTGPYEYSFWVYGAATGYVWVQKAVYSTSNTWTWTTTSADIGYYYVCVWARTVGSAASYETFSNCAVTFASPPNSSTLTLSLNVGSPVTFTGTASGGSGSYEYSFWIMGPGTGNVWQNKQTYSTTSTWTWTPTSSDKGTSTVCVWVRNAGSSTTYETYTMYSGVNVQ